MPSLPTLHMCLEWLSCLLKRRRKPVYTCVRTLMIVMINKQSKMQHINRVVDCMYMPIIINKHNNVICLTLLSMAYISVAQQVRLKTLTFRMLIWYTAIWGVTGHLWFSIRSSLRNHCYRIPPNHNCSRLSGELRNSPQAYYHYRICKYLTLRQVDLSIKSLGITIS